MKRWLFPAIGWAGFWHGVVDLFGWVLLLIPYATSGEAGLHPRCRFRCSDRPTPAYE